MIVAGFIMARTHWLGRNFWDGCERLILFCALPRPALCRAYPHEFRRRSDRVDGANQRRRNARGNGIGRADLVDPPHEPNRLGIGNSMRLSI